MVLTPTLELCEPEDKAVTKLSEFFTPTFVSHSFGVLSNFADCNYSGNSLCSPYFTVFFNRGSAVFVLRITSSSKWSLHTAYTCWCCEAQYCELSFFIVSACAWLRKLLDGQSWSPHWTFSEVFNSSVSDIFLKFIWLVNVFKLIGSDNTTWMCMCTLIISVWKCKGRS